MMIVNSLKTHFLKNISFFLAKTPKQSMNSIITSSYYLFSKTKQGHSQTFKTEEMNNTKDKSKVQRTQQNENSTQTSNTIRRNVNQIMAYYKRQVSKQNFLLESIIPICKELSQLYSRQTHLQFALQRKQLQMLLQHLGRLQLKNATFQDYLSIMQLIRALKSVQNISKSFIQTVKDIVLLKLAPYREKLSLLSLEKQVRLYSLLSDLEEEYLASLVTIIAQQLNQNKEQTKISPKSLILLLQSLGKKQNWLSAEELLVQHIFKALKQKLQHFDQISILKTASAINSNRFLIVKNFRSFDEINIFVTQKLNQLLKNGLQPRAMKYALSADMQSGNFLSSFYNSIYSNVMDRLKGKQSHYLLLDHHNRVASKLRGKTIEEKDTEVVIDYISFALKDKQLKESLFKKKRCEIYLLQLIQAKYFDQNIKILDKILTKGDIQVYWTFPYEYSIRQALFPFDLMLNKIKPGSLQLKMDVNYLKMAVSIAIQTWLHDNTKLEQIYESIKKKANSSKFGLPEVEWLIKQYQANPNIVRAYHKYYCRQFEQIIYKTYSPILFSSQSVALKYWRYIINVCQPDDKFIKMIPYKIIKYMVQRQFYFYQNESSVINRLFVQKLMQMISLQKVQSQKETKDIRLPESFFKEKINKLLLLWFQRLPNTDQKTVKVYIEFIILIMKQQPKQNLEPAFKMLIAKLVISEFKILHSADIFSSLKKGIEQHLKDEELIDLLQNLKKRGRIESSKPKTDN